MSQITNTDFVRPSNATIKKLSQIPTNIISDCLNRFQALDGAIQALKPEWKVAGPAITIQSMESCNWGAHQALALAKKGDVLVISARGGMMNAIWGHVMTFAAKQAGLAGVIIDGCIRDAKENREDSLPIFCRGVSPGGPHKGWPCNINVPISCGGVAILPGDLIIGDENGVVSIPANQIEMVLKEADKKIATEEEWYERMAKGEKTVDILNIRAK